MACFRFRIARAILIVLVASAHVPRVTSAQVLTGALVGTVKDEQGGVPCRRARPRDLTGADRRIADRHHERQGATAVSGPPARDVRARRRADGIRAVSRGGHHASAPAPPSSERSC